MSAVIINIAQYPPITEDNKEEMIQWLQENVEALSDPNYDYGNRNINRIFGTPDDDIHVMRDLCGRFLVTLQQFVLLKK